MCCYAYEVYGGLEGLERRGLGDKERHIGRRRRVGHVLDEEGLGDKIVDNHWDAGSEEDRTVDSMCNWNTAAWC